MEVMIEAIAVAIYVVILNIYIKDIFFLGFAKHFIAGILNVHKMYCDYKKFGNYKFNLQKLIIESIIEGLLFVAINKVGLPVPAIGFTLHIAFEILGIHKQFCS